MDPDPYTDPDPYRDPGKMCLGVGMHCPSASGWTMLMTVWKASQKQFFLFTGLNHLLLLTFVWCYKS